MIKKKEKDLGGREMESKWRKEEKETIKEREE